MTNATVAVGYIRVSTESQLDGLGLDVQRTAITDLAAELGLGLHHVHADEGISGSEDITGRAGLAAALDDIAQGNATVLLVPKLDRLARDLMVQESVLRDVWAAGGTVVPCVEGERVYCQPDDPTDPSRTLIRQVLGAVAAYERAMIRARLVAGRRRRIAEDGYAGGPEPYGWTDPAEQAILSHVRWERDLNVPWHHIANRLNRVGLMQRNGAKWIPTSIQRTYARAMARTEITAAVHPVLVDEFPQQTSMIGAHR